MVAALPLVLSRLLLAAAAVDAAITAKLVT